MTGESMVRIWMKVDAKNDVSEFLLIVGGDDNVLIYITGKLQYERSGRSLQILMEEILIMDL
jgi:hypothetical protein